MPGGAARGRSGDRLSLGSILARRHVWLRRRLPLSGRELAIRAADVHDRAPEEDHAIGGVDRLAASRAARLGHRVTSWGGPIIADSRGRSQARPRPIPAARGSPVTPPPGPMGDAVGGRIGQIGHGPPPWRAASRGRCGRKGGAGRGLYAGDPARRGQGRPAGRDRAPQGGRGRRLAAGQPAGAAPAPGPLRRPGVRPGRPGAVSRSRGPGGRGGRRRGTLPGGALRPRGPGAGAVAEAGQHITKQRLMWVTDAWLSAAARS